MNHHQTALNQLQTQSGHTFSAKEKDDVLQSNSEYQNINKPLYEQIERSEDSRTPVKNKKSCEQTGYSYTSTSSVRRFGARYVACADERGNSVPIAIGIRVWLSVDPMSDKYPSLSAYKYCAGNPINLVDPDGCYFVGIFGQKVKVTQREDGTLKAGLFATRDLKYLIRKLNNSGSLIALNQVFDPSQNGTKIHVKTIRKFQKEDYKDGSFQFGLHQTHDVDANILNWNDTRQDFDGSPAYLNDFEYKEATITIFVGNIKKVGKDGGVGAWEGFSISIDQEIANTFQHETNHNTDREFIQDLKNRRDGKQNKGLNAHDNIKPQERKVLKEMYEFNKKGEKSEIQ